jgi:hypothetical protein
MAAGMSAIPEHSDDPHRNFSGKSTRLVAWTVALLLIVLGSTLRIVPSAGFQGVGFDESIYRRYLLQLDRVGLTEYPAICEFHIADQAKQESIAKLPPTRFLYICSAWIWKRITFGDDPPGSSDSPAFVKDDPALVSLHRVACLFSILLLALCGVAGVRMLGTPAGLGVLALMAFAPLQIHMAQHALIDGFFAFWAMLCLWLLWENLRSPNDPRWLAPFGVALACMVLTKENAFFVYAALLGGVAGNRWAKFGKVTLRLLLVMVLGPLCGLTLLIILAGGTAQFFQIYQLLVAKAQTLDYAILTGDGPWHRYLVDLMLMSPLILCLAISAGLAVLKENKALLFLTGFVFFSYLIMCNVRYGMNLRYTTIWDFPLRALAIAQLSVLAGAFGSRKPLGMILLLAGVCAHELHQYVVYFKDGGLYELVTEGLLRAVKILK